MDVCSGRPGPPVIFGVSILIGLFQTRAKREGNWPRREATQVNAREREGTPGNARSNTRKTRGYLLRISRRDLSKNARIPRVKSKGTRGNARSTRGKPEENPRKTRGTFEFDELNDSQNDPTRGPDPPDGRRTGRRQHHNPHFHFLGD